MASLLRLPTFPGGSPFINGVAVGCFEYVRVALQYLAIRGGFVGLFRGAMIFVEVFSALPDVAHFRAPWLNIVRHDL